MVVKTDTCVFSNFRIYPGHGRVYVRTDGKSFRFINAKTAASFTMKRNPRKIAWTIFYRRLRKKGTQEDALKKAKKRVTSTSVMNRGIAGISIEDLKAKKSESGDKRKAMRDATVREAKDKNRKAQDEKKKVKKVAPAGGAPGGAAVKMGKAGGAGTIAPGRSSAPGKKSAR